MPAPAGPLLERLHRDADQAIAQLLAAAEQDAARIRADADARRTRHRSAAVAACEADLTRQRDAARHAAEQGTVRGVLLARAAFLDRVFERADALLNELPRNADFARRLTPLLVDALPFVEGAGARVRCAPACTEGVRAALGAAGAGPTDVVADDRIPAGAVVENAAGDVRVDATFAARLRRLRPALAIDAVRAIEGEEASS